MDIVDRIKYNFLQKFHFFVPQKDLISNIDSISCITSVCDIKLVYIAPLENVPIFGSTKLLPKMAEDRCSVNSSFEKWKGGNEAYFESNDVSIDKILKILSFLENLHFFHKKWLINIYPTTEKYTSLKKYHSTYPWLFQKILRVSSKMQSSKSIFSTIMDYFAEGCSMEITP